MTYNVNVLMFPSFNNQVLNFYSNKCVFSACKIQQTKQYFSLASTQVIQLLINLLFTHSFFKKKISQSPLALSEILVNVPIL